MNGNDDVSPLFGNATSDGHKCYVDAIEGAFGSDVDFAQLVKQYGGENRDSGEARYSPAVCTCALWHV